MRGEPSAAELAAMIAVLRVRAAALASVSASAAPVGPTAPAPSGRGWADRSRLVRAPLDDRYPSAWNRPTFPR